MHATTRPAPDQITLEQWEALVAVVDAGSYAKAAETLHKSQSTLTYAVQKLESLLGREGVRDPWPQGGAHADRRAAATARAHPAR